MKYKMIFLFILSGLPFCSSTAQDSTKRWSLQDCLNYAKAHNISLQQSQTDIQIAKDQQLAAKGQLLPSLNASASQNYNIGLGIDPVTNQKKVQTTNSNNFGMSANWTLFNGFYVFNGIKKATQDVLATKYQSRQQQYQLTIRVINGYLQILLNAEMLQAAKRQLHLSKKFYNDMQIKWKAGDKSKADFADATAQLAEDKQQKIMAENNLKIARRNLAQEMQLKNTKDFRIIYTIPALADTAITAQPIEQIYEQALKSYPAIQEGKAAVKSAGFNWRMAKSNLWPSIGFSAGINTLYSNRYLDNTGNKIPFNRQIQDNLGHYFGFNLSIPIFNNLYSRSNIHIAQRGIDKAELQAKQNSADLWQALQTIYSNIQLYRQSYQASQEAKNALEQALHYAKINYQSGNSAYYDYLQARNRYLDAQSATIRDKYQYLYNTILLNYYYKPNF